MTPSPRSRLLTIVALTAALLTAAHGLRAQATKETVEGVMNFARVGTTVACAGATSPKALAKIKEMGFASVIDLRLATEPGAEIDAEAAAAKAAGLNFVHLPLSGARPDPAVVAPFLKAVGDPANQPAFIHCGSGERSAAMWMIKRVELDGWDLDRAGVEAAALGLTSPKLRQFAVDYVHTHPKQP